MSEVKNNCFGKSGCSSHRSLLRCPGDARSGVAVSDRNDEPAFPILLFPSSTRNTSSLPKLPIHWVSRTACSVSPASGQPLLSFF